MLAALLGSSNYGVELVAGPGWLEPDHSSLLGTADATSSDAKVAKGNKGMKMNGDNEKELNQ